VTTGFLLDANVFGELRLARTGNENVIALVDSIPRNLQFISVITLLEVEQGVLRKERQDPAQGAKLRIWLDNAVRPNFGERVLPVTETVALRGARLHVPDKKPERDALIAATALVHDLAVVTRNVKDFSPMNVAVLNPWD
jgi:predicted nucleic acid-binding protein